MHNSPYSLFIVGILHPLSYSVCTQIYSIELEDFQALSWILTTVNSQQNLLTPALMTNNGLHFYYL